MEKLEEKTIFSPEKDAKSILSNRFGENRGSMFSYLSYDSLSEKETETQSLTDNNNQFQQIVDQFFYTTPLQSIITKFCNNQITDYIFHTKIYLEYDEENAFIFIFKNSLVFTHIFDEKSKVTENPIIYIVKFQQVNLNSK
jgi:hypothetical protein